MRRTLRNLTALVVGFSLVLLFGAIARGGTFKTTHKGIEYTIQTPDCFPEFVTLDSASRLVTIGPRLNGVVWERDDGQTLFGIALGSEPDKEDLYPVQAVCGKTDQDWKKDTHFAYYDYVNPTKVSAEAIEAWLQAHKLGKPKASTPNTSESGTKRINI